MKQHVFGYRAEALIPKGIVEIHKRKDISGQRVLDASAILMNDERIELKF